MNKTRLTQYFSDPKQWGNIFQEHNFMGDNPIFVTNKSPTQIIQLTEQPRRRNSTTNR